MFSLLRADLYRATRIRGFRGHFWQYATVLLVIAALEIGLIVLALSGFFDGIDGLEVTSNLGVTPAEFLGTNLFGSYSVLAFAASFGIIEMLFVDLTDGFAKTMTSSLRGNLAYFAEKMVFAGVWSGILMLVAIVLNMGGLALFVMLPYGISFQMLDAIGAFALWALCSWLACWVTCLLPLALAFITRNKLVTYGFMVSVLLGFIPLIIRALAFSSGGVLKVLEPLAPVLLSLSSWMPSSVLQALTDGAGNMLYPTGMLGVGELPTWAWMLGTCLIWMVLAGGAWLLAAKKRDL